MKQVNSHPGYHTHSSDWSSTSALSKVEQTIWYCSRLLLMFTLLMAGNFSGYSQIVFEKGYYIDNQGNKIEGLIKNKDWEKNPSEFQFKSSEAAVAVRIPLDSAREFVIEGQSRHIRATVDIDRSSDNLQYLSVTPAPEFKKEQLFLKVLVDRKAMLYKYLGNGNLRFFYRIGDGPIQQLVFKSYKVKSSVGTNDGFRSQLKAAFNCATPAPREIDLARYIDSDLIKLFVRYNNCVEGHDVTVDQSKKRDVFNLWLRPRWTISSATLFRDTREYSLPDQSSVGGGVEAEFLLPFNKSKWAMIIEPTYQTYVSENASIPAGVKYQALELPIGVRHYFYLNERSKLSLAAAWQLDFPLGSTAIYYRSLELTTSKTTNFAFEGGYVFNNKFCISYRYQTPRAMLGNYLIWSSNFSTMAVIVGYSPF